MVLYYQLAVGGTDFRVAGVAADAEDAEGVALLLRHHVGGADAIPGARIEAEDLGEPAQVGNLLLGHAAVGVGDVEEAVQQLLQHGRVVGEHAGELACVGLEAAGRSEEHTSELQSLMRISY